MRPDKWWDYSVRDVEGKVSMRESVPSKRHLELLTFCRRRKNNGVEFKILRMENPIECRIAERINRFVLKIRVRRDYYRAWINNTGRLHRFLVKGRKGFCVRNEKGGRTDYRLFSIKEGNLGAIIDTQLQMRVFGKSLEMKLVPWLKECRILKVNAKLGQSLIDYLLKCGGKEVYVEVKSAVLRQGHHGMYPDCPSRRGRKHIEELASHAKQGGKATILFIAALPGVWAFKPNRSADPKLHKLLLEAHQEGVGIKSIGMFYNPKDSFVYLSNPDLLVNVS